MASSNYNHPIRSISFPTRSHSSTPQVEEELNNLKIWEASISSSAPTADGVCNGLKGLERLYRCVDNLLSLPLTQQALSHQKHERSVDEFLDRSMRLLNICGSLREVVSQVKEHVQDIQSALRRRKGDLSIDMSFLKKLKKEAKRSIAALKQIDNQIGDNPLLDADHHLSLVIRALREVSAASISVFSSLLSFICLSVSKPRSTKWSIVSKLIHKDQPQIPVEILDFHTEDFDSSLELIFKNLIRTRATLLNVLSHKCKFVAAEASEF